MRKEDDFLFLKNQESLGSYYWRVHMQGGSHYYRARDLQDLRNHTQREWYRAIETMVIVARNWIEQLTIKRINEANNVVCMFHRKQAS